MFNHCIDTMLQKTRSAMQQSHGSTCAQPLADRVLWCAPCIELTAGDMPMSAAVAAATVEAVEPCAVEAAAAKWAPICAGADRVSSNESFSIDILPADDECDEPPMSGVKP